MTNEPCLAAVCSSPLVALGAIGGKCRLPTNLLSDAPAFPSVRSVITLSESGIKIANSMGVPGTLGCITRTRDDSQSVLLTSWHVLFGNGGADGNVVWLVNETNGTRQYWKIGRTLYGKFGKVRFDGEDYHVDCAVSSFLSPLEVQYCCPIISEYDVAQPGDVVTKVGAATGITVGIVADVNYSDYAWLAGRSSPAQQQLLVRPLDNKVAFSAEGDSGALLFNARGKPVGLLWGTNSRGEGVVCPMAPVVHAMNLKLEQSQ